MIFTGVSLLFSSPVPSRPLDPFPVARAVSSFLRKRLCFKPADTARTLSIIFTGVSKFSSLPVPSRPLFPDPVAHTVLFSKSRMLCFPHADTLPTLVVVVVMRVVVVVVVVGARLRDVRRRGDA